MAQFKKWIVKELNSLTEAAYEGAIGFEEMVKFYNVASDAQIAEMEKLIKNDDWEAYKKLIKKVINVKL